MRWSVGIKVLKNKLSEYVRLAASETVLVTDRDRVVAELVPPRTHDNEIDPEAGMGRGAVRLGNINAGKTETAVNTATNRPAS